MHVRVSTNVLTRSAVSGSVGPSEEKWIPLENRLRMLKREMEAFKYNNDRHTKHLEDLHKSQPRGAELERAKKREHYSGKKKKRCSLCEQQFALVNLPLAISYKAILDLRTRSVLRWCGSLCVAHLSCIHVLQLGSGCRSHGAKSQHGALPALLQRSSRMHVLCTVF